MTNKEESHLSMYLTFKEFQASYTAITAPLPNYTTNSTTFLNAIPQIQTLAEQQKISKKGVTAGKNKLKDALIALAVDNARKMMVYAKFTNNATLAEEINITESKFRQATDTGVKDYAQIIYDRIQPIVASLASYGITAATQTALLNAINAYNATIGKPGLGKAESKQLTLQLKALFKTAEAALANMDAAVEIVRLTQANFYAGYQKAREVVDSGARTLAVKGQVSDAVTGKPVKGATVTFTAEATTNSPNSGGTVFNIVKKSADKGGFLIKNLAPGVYRVSAGKNGYAEQVRSIAVSDGETSDVNFELAKK